MNRGLTPHYVNIIEWLSKDGIPLDGCDSNLIEMLEALARSGSVELHAGLTRDKLILIPSRDDFKLHLDLISSDCLWQVSRFAYMHFSDGVLVARSPIADCWLSVNDETVSEILYSLKLPSHLPASEPNDYVMNACRMLARAQIIVPCGSSGEPFEAHDPEYRQWDFHDLLFHSLSRLGRTTQRMGGVYAFRGEIEPLPAAKEHQWAGSFCALPRPDIPRLSQIDISLTTAIETRRSIRQYSIVPLSLEQLGEFLFRTVRTRYILPTAAGELLSRPYANGGGIYEQEFYVTIDACLDYPRGFYYYDHINHGLCLISYPTADMELLIDEASASAARAVRPQVVITIASRFHRLGWKYRGMAYATQLKNVGAIYQTMYLVATSMNVGGCALGIGNSDRLCRMTGEDYLVESSIGEFMLGRSL
ncbi:SagB family peptide dehydrogenase [Mesorhizobium sp. WSM3873]|uniref:SagB family peptide dehydrogenase n=1 Tax=Mesorhizobium sp. WSM3873 TaxID=1854056 RepID=UPI0018D48558|nr:SagB family peptide dehydrogenase [Mesorhizobium sp. WSM3873]